MDHPSPAAHTGDEPRGPAGSSPAPSRLVFGVTLGLLALLLVVSARSDPPVELDSRIDGRLELIELIRSEQARVEQLTERADDLAAEVASAEQAARIDPELVAGLEAKIDEVAGAAGLSAVRGPGVRAELTDSSLSEAPTGDPNDLVIHEEDLQGVINALWAGGAEAMSVQGERITATTAIRCVGNTLLLHGAVYSPPYVVEAVGDPVALTTALDRDPSVERFRATASEYDLGYKIDESDDLLVPAREGTVGLQVAAPGGRMEGNE